MTNDLANTLSRLSLETEREVRIKVGCRFIEQFLLTHGSEITSVSHASEVDTFMGVAFEVHWMMPPFGWAIVDRATYEVLAVGTIRPDAAP